MKYVHVFTFLIVLMFVTACNGQVIKDSPKEKVEHPKLIKTIGNPAYGNVQCGLQDKAGNLWFGTTHNGLYKYDGKSFSQFTVTNGLNSNNISSIFEDKDGKIWIGTGAAGVCLYDGKTFAKIQIPLRKNLPPNKNEYYRNSHWVFSIIQDKSGKLWFATIDGVYIYDGKSLPTEQAGFTPFIVNEGAGGFMSSNNNMEYILEDKASNIWFGGRSFGEGRTNEGVYRYDGKSITNLKPDGDNWAWPVLQDKNGNIWFSNWNGAYRYDGKSFTSFTNSDGLPGKGSVMRIIEDKNGNLWFSGEGGICRYDGKSFTCFTKKDGLINHAIWTILEDKNGNLWFWW
jgi:ligand-binding sensor domain-containing protein